MLLGSVKPVLRESLASQPFAFIRMSSRGSSPARTIHMSERLCCTGATQCTLQRALAQIERLDVITELADVARQREALVAGEADRTTLGLHADEREREFACAKLASHLASAWYT